ncbi:hypothetical protein [Halorussus halophilus]|uniref:hypothetical protein n=1 Tax=Halorussus halophilus TaxID=2650975 RepID=UPI0013016B67|nr:hypothetical protein [Halorussus halophilus]
MNPSQLLEAENWSAPLVGAVLVVVLTVALSATVGTALTGMATSSPSPPAQATADIDIGEESVTVTWTANVDAEQLRVQLAIGDRTAIVTLNAVGDAVRVDSTGLTTRGSANGSSIALSDGERVEVTVVAINGDRKGIVANDSASV